MLVFHRGFWSLGVAEQKERERCIGDGREQCREAGKDLEVQEVSNGFNSTFMGRTGFCMLLSSLVLLHFIISQCLAFSVSKL